MTCLDLTLTTPAENLALEEALLDAAEAGQGGEVLRFWESPEYFVVVGYANKIASEVNTAACEAKGIPILRRCSGGGTVVQGPGCLNYAVVLRITEDGPTRSIQSANQFVMERVRDAISQLLSPDSQLLIAGHTDLTVATQNTPRAALKFSGNAQRRRKNFLLFHGSILLNFDLRLIGELLNMPSLQPDYRNGRSHADFITNLKLSAQQVKQSLVSDWNAQDAQTPSTKITPELLGKYRSEEWNRKF